MNEHDKLIIELVCRKISESVHLYMEREKVDRVTRTIIDDLITLGRLASEYEIITSTIFSDANAE